MLSLTQKRLLRKAAENPRGQVAVTSGFITSRRKSRYGTREADAAIALRKAGLLELVANHHSVHHLSHGFGADHGSDTVWKLTDKGRELAATL